jgi:Lrp/AsnC family transcriptional regulator for asnA, asnC and gidA
LIAAGIINKFTISVDNNRLGYSHLAYMGVNIECGYVDDVTNNLCKVDEVLEVHEMHGIFDLFIKIRAKDLDQLRDIVQNKICRFPHILETELMTVLKTGKEEHTTLSSLKKDRSVGLNY